MAVDLRVNIGGIQMRNPVMVASGTFGYGPEYADVLDLKQLGAIVVKGISLEGTRGNPPPRTVEVTSGLINAIGLQNPGLEGFVGTYMPFLRQYDVPVIVNIWGRTIEEYTEVAARFDRVPGIAGLEVNVSCPNIKEGRSMFGTNMEMFKRVVAEVRKKTRLPLIIKLAPDISNLPSFAKAAEECGADALSLINSIPAMAIDIKTRKPKLGNVTGGLSGPAIRPIAVKLVWEAAKAVKIPIIGLGGISSMEDAAEFFIAGASAVAVGTANFAEPDTAIRIIQKLPAYLRDNGMLSISQLVGSLRL
ncbi:MAG: dihydroorotate dehydrogenase [Lentisphaerota bacterium]